MKHRKSMEIGYEYFHLILSGKITWIRASDVDLETEEKTTVCIGDEIELNEIDYGRTGRAAIVYVTDVSSVPCDVYAGPVSSDQEVNIASIRLLHSFLKIQGIRNEK